MTVHSIAMARWIDAFNQGDYAQVGARLSESVRIVADAGADFAILNENSRLHHIQDDERRRIARELHDSVGQAGVKMTLAQVNQRDLETKAKTALSESNEMLDRCIGEIRTISHLLHPPLLDETGLIVLFARDFFASPKEHVHCAALAPLSPHDTHSISILPALDGCQPLREISFDYNVLCSHNPKVTGSNA